MSNKTALQEILSKLKEHEHLYGNMYPQFESWLKEGLEKERLEIEKAYNDAYSNCTYSIACGTDVMTKEEYFNSKYGNNEE